MGDYSKPSQVTVTCQIDSSVPPTGASLGLAGVHPRSPTNMLGAASALFGCAFSISISKQDVEKLGDEIEERKLG